MSTSSSAAANFRGPTLAAGPVLAPGPVPEAAIFFARFGSAAV
jgi:hypothetical protein